LKFTEQVQSLTHEENDYPDFVVTINDEEKLDQGGSFEYENTRGKTMEELEITFYHESTNAEFPDAAFGGEIIGGILSQGFLNGHIQMHSETRNPFYFGCIYRASEIKVFRQSCVIPSLIKSPFVPFGKKHWLVSRSSLSPPPS
jgi:hypothetical protein